ATAPIPGPSSGSRTSPTCWRKPQNKSIPFTNGICHCIMVCMRAIPVDKAGRVVLPKDLRDKLRLEAGDELLVEESGEDIVLRPVRTQATLKKERGVWVYQGGRGGKRSTESLPDLIDEAREERIREFSE